MPYHVCVARAFFTAIWRATLRRPQTRVGGPRSVVAVQDNLGRLCWMSTWRATLRRGRARQFGGPRSVVAVFGVSDRSAMGQKGNGRDRSASLQRTSHGRAANRGHAPSWPCKTTWGDCVGCRLGGPRSVVAVNTSPADAPAECFSTPQRCLERLHLVEAEGHFGTDVH